MSGSFDGLGSPPWRVVGSAQRKPRSLGVIDVPVVLPKQLLFLKEY